MMIIIKKNFYLNRFVFSRFLYKSTLLENVRKYSGSGFSNLNKELKCIYKMDKINFNIVSNFIKTNECDLVNPNFIKIIEDRVNDSNFVYGYKKVESFFDVNNLIDEDYDLNKFLNNEEFKSKFYDVLNQLDGNKIYKLIYRWQSISNELGDISVDFNTSDGFVISNESDIDVILYKFYNDLVLFDSKYGFSGTINVDLFIKEWITNDDFKSFQLILNKIKEQELSLKKNKIDCNNNLKQITDGLLKNGYFKSDFKKIMNLSISGKIMGINYGNVVGIDYINKYNLKEKINLKLDDVLYLHTIKDVVYLVKVIKLSENENYVYIYLEKCLNNNNIVEIEKWKDIINYNDDGDVIVNRFLDKKGLTINFLKNTIGKINIKYNSKELSESYKDYEHNDSIGVIDIETYKDENNNSVPFSIGFKNIFHKQLFYIDEYKNSDEMIISCLDKLLCTENHNFKFYAHNMSDFDGILILKSLMNLIDRPEFSFKVYSDNKGNLVSIDITKRIKNKKVIKISILDSYLLLPFSLKKLGVVFKSKKVKGVFPYNFINKNTLNYVGKVPEKKYFSELSLLDYNTYANKYRDKWSAKNETLVYLESDLDVLYIVMHKFSDLIFTNLKINITRVRTISGLAFLIYTSKYYKQNENPIYFTSGKLEKFIRQGYYGGIVDVVINYSDKITYKYDVNSHYPNAMLNPMPGGKPRISSEKNIQKIFGFVEAVVEAPSEKELKVAILPNKENSKTGIFRGMASGVWFSEELKLALKYGYKIIEIKTCIEFDKVYGLFNEYIKDIYEKKRLAELNKNDVERFVNKLLLNSLYGRMGINDYNIKLKIVDKNKIEKVLNTENSDILYEGVNNFLVKSNGPLDPEILRIINNEKLYSKELDYSDFNSKNPWTSVSSSVHLSAAITAYARMYLNQFKNMDDNNYLGGDTDSIILSKPLDPIFVGDKLGQLKLEYVIKEGFYLSKKFYLIVTMNNEIIIKSKGINNVNNELTYNSFVELFKGNSINIKQIEFSKNYKTLEVSLNYVNKTIQGLKKDDIKYLS